MRTGIMPVLVFVAGCSAATPQSTAPVRDDGAERLEIDLNGSLQNPAFSPDGNRIVFTRFRRGYNAGPADLFIFDLRTGGLTPLVADGSANINLPGASWNKARNTIVFSSDRGAHDEIFTIPANGQPGDEAQLTDRPDLQGFEPSFSADGSAVVFESHEIDNDEGVITIFGKGVYTDLTQEGRIIKQPNWSPLGQILYQELQAERWAVWTMNASGAGARRVTPAEWSSTDAAFSANGQWIVFSAENDNVANANIFRIPAGGGRPDQITGYGGYDGAPSISPAGDVVVFESAPGDPDGRAGTTIWVIRP